MRFNPDESTKAVVDVSANVQTVGAKNGAGIDCQGYEFCTFIVDLGTLGSSATIDFKTQESSDDAAADAYADISGSAITQQTQAGTDASNTVVALTVNCANQERYLRGVLTIGTATSDAGSVAFLSNPKAAPAV